MKLGVFGYDDTVVKVFDVAEPDPAKKLIATYDNYKKAGQYLGLTGSTVQHFCSIKGKTHSPFLKKMVALRLSAKPKEDDSTRSYSRDLKVSSGTVPFIIQGPNQEELGYPKAYQT